MTNTHRAGPWIFVGGVTAPDLGAGGMDLAHEAGVAMTRLAATLAAQGSALSRVVRLGVYFLAEAPDDGATILAALAAGLGKPPGPVVSLIPVPNAPAPGRRLQIEALAVAADDPDWRERRACAAPNSAALPKPFSAALRVGELIVTGSQDAATAAGGIAAAGDLIGQSRIAMAKLQALVEGLGVALADVVKINNYYSGGGCAEDWEGAARARAAFFEAHGPAATGVPLPGPPHDHVLTRIEVMAVLPTGDDRRVWPEGHWDWTIPMPYRHGVLRRGLFCIGGQVSLDSQARVISPHDLMAQTANSLDNIARVLDALGAGFDQIAKLTVFLGTEVSPEGHCSLDGLLRDRFAGGGPAITKVGLPYLAYEGMVVEIEAIGVSS